MLNLDDKAFEIWKTRAAGRKVLTFALSNISADFYASDLDRDARGCPAFNLHSPEGVERVQLNLLGTHNVANAMAAAAAAHALGVSLFGIATGLGAVQPVKGRTVAQLATNGMRVIDDTYNANPTSMCAAVDILAGFFRSHRFWCSEISASWAIGRSRGTATWASTPAAKFPRFTRSGQ